MARDNRYDGVRVDAKSDPDRLPFEFEVRRNVKPLVFGLIVAGLIGLLAWNANDVLPLHLLGEHRALAEYIAPGVIGVIALLFALSTIYRQFSRQSIRITDDTVSVTRRTPLGARDWTESLAAYRGVRWKRFVLARNRSSGQSTAPRYRNVIELAHEDPERNLPLVVFTSGRAGAVATLALAKSAFSNPNPSAEQKAEMEQKAETLARQARGDHLRATWESLAAALGIPAIDARDGGETIREVDDLDKSVRELAADGKADSGWTYTPPPDSIELVPAGDGRVTLVIRATDLPMMIWLFGGLGVAMFLLGAFTLQFGLALGGLAFAGFAAFIHFMGKASPRRLTIADGQLTHEFPNRKQGNFKVDLAAIEGIEIRDVDADQAHGRTMKLRGKQLWITSDQGEYTAGAGLKPDALEWLRAYVLDAARKA